MKDIEKVIELLRDPTTRVSIKAIQVAGLPARTHLLAIRGCSSYGMRAWGCLLHTATPNR